VVTPVHSHGGQPCTDPGCGFATAKPRRCKDCAAEGIATARPAPHPGPRCTTHHRAFRKRRAAATHVRDTQRRYGLTEDEYRKLYEHQGRRCAICRRATGATKRLAVDHDHSCCPGPTSCGGCVRGLVCGPCNSVLAHVRDDTETLQRFVRYLREWPARTAGI
jgi:hypothetical protein